MANEKNREKGGAGSAKNVKVVNEKNAGGVSKAKNKAESTSWSKAKNSK